MIVDSKTLKPVKLGDFLEVKSQKNCSFGCISTYEKFMITKENVDELIEKGILKVVNKEDKDSIPTDLTYYIKKLAKDIHTPFNDVCNMLDYLNTQSPGLVLTLLVAQIAKVCNEKANMTLEKAKELYYISLNSGDIFSSPLVTSAKYTNYFFKYEDAVLAKKILTQQFAMMYGK